MNRDHPSDALDDPEYLRIEASLLRKTVVALADQQLKEQLAAHSLCLAQRAEAISRVPEERGTTSTNIERDRPNFRPLADETGFHGSLRELAAWYRSFAERAGNPAIWEARLRMAEDLESEAERMERDKRRR